MQCWLVYVRRTQNEFLISWGSVLNGKTRLNYASHKRVYNSCFIFVLNGTLALAQQIYGLYKILHSVLLYLPIKGLNLMSMPILHIYLYVL